MTKALDSEYSEYKKYVQATKRVGPDLCELEEEIRGSSKSSRGTQIDEPGPMR